MYQGERAFLSSASVTCRIFPAAARVHSPGWLEMILRFSGCFPTSHLWHHCCPVCRRQVNLEVEEK